MNKEKKLVKVLIKGTKEKRIKWLDVPGEYFYGHFNKSGEKVVDAFYFERDHKTNIIVYKSSIVTSDPYGDEIETTNIHIVIADIANYNEKFKFTDYEFEDSHELWTLFKLIQRQKNNIDAIIDDIINDFDV